MPDPDGVRQTGWVLCPGGLDSLIEGISQEMLAGFWLDSKKTTWMLGLQISLQLTGVDLLGTVNDRSGLV
jgi:hypothetical protein